MKTLTSISNTTLHTPSENKSLNRKSFTPPFLNGPWESISMGYMLGLPSIKHGNDCFFFVMDRFFNMSMLIACKKSISVLAIANLFFEHVWLHFGLPRTIISDEDSRFLSNFWSSLWSMMDTKLTKSTSFHPQTHRQIEVVK